MGDILEAIQNLSIGLSDRIARLAAERGWGSKPYSWISADRERFFQIVATTIAFPGGHYASFTPRAEATGSTWFIDVRRTDGRERPSWSGGLRVAKGEKGWAVMGDGGTLTDPQLAALLEDLANG